MNLIGGFYAASEIFLTPRKTKIFLTPKGVCIRPFAKIFLTPRKKKIFLIGKMNLIGGFYGASEIFLTPRYEIAPGKGKIGYLSPPEARPRRARSAANPRSARPARRGTSMTWPAASTGAWTNLLKHRQRRAKNCSCWTLLRF